MAPCQRVSRQSSERCESVDHYDQTTIVSFAYLIRGPSLIRCIGCMLYCTVRIWRSSTARSSRRTDVGPCVQPGLWFPSVTCALFRSYQAVSACTMMTLWVGLFVQLCLYTVPWRMSAAQNPFSFSTERPRAVQTT